ncbi:MAG: putative chromosome-partitioning protein ParB [Alphaproteobacteria bacterium MarineAlpha5_Bin9]|nr:MAG: putative chromosome-partitioning protein ParB [Alphaproteobacteria bacterium MarineAlpha5_Bin9]
MNNENNKLGRGLASLLSSRKDVEKTDSSNINIVPITSIRSNKNQPRKNFKEQELEELAKSIKSKGILQPIIVRKTNQDSYEIVAGERRWRAAQIAGVHDLPVVIKNISDLEVMQIALIENIQRENLNPVEEAKAYKVLLKQSNSNYNDLISLVSKSRSHISNMIRLLDLDEEILKLIEQEKISMGHARALIGVPNALELANEIIDKKLSVREVEKTSAQHKKRNNKKPKLTKDANIVDLEKELSEKIGLKTSIHFNQEGSSGSITLYYSDLDQLDDIMKRLKKV